MTFAEHVTKAIRQLLSGETISRRGTPVVSFWDMKPKWEKWGNAWTYIGSDGSPFAERENGVIIVPCLLRLVYFKTHDGKVCQLAYEIDPEVIGPYGSVAIENAASKFMRETGRMPKSLDNLIEISA